MISFDKNDAVPHYTHDRQNTEDDIIHIIENIYKV